MHWCEEWRNQEWLRKLADKIKSNIRWQVLLAGHKLNKRTIIHLKKDTQRKSFDIHVCPHVGVFNVCIPVGVFIGVSLCIFRRKEEFTIIKRTHCLKFRNESLSLLYKFSISRIFLSFLCGIIHKKIRYSSRVEISVSQALFTYGPLLSLIIRWKKKIYS